MSNLNILFFISDKILLLPVVYRQLVLFKFSNLSMIVFYDTHKLKKKKRMYNIS